MKPTTKNNYFKIVLKNLQYLSLDVVVGALAMGLFVTRLLQVNPNKWWWLVLSLSVWAVYTADHLMDGFSRKGLAVIRRHRMHYLYRIPLVIAVALAVVSAVLLTFLYLNKITLLGGFFLGLLALLYLTFIRLGEKYRYYFHKELFISLFYVTGIWLCPVSIHVSPLSPFHWLILISMLLIVWYEGVLVSTFELENDINDGHNSFAVKYGNKKSTLFLTILFLTIGVLSLILFFLANSRTHYFAVLIEVVMATLLYMLSRFPVFFKKHEYYKTIGELIFWLPGLLYFVN